MRTFALSLCLVTIAGLSAPNEDKAYLGVQLADLTQDLRKTFRHEHDGVLIRHVIHGSSADEAGLLDHDLILELNGKRVGSTKELVEQLGNQHAGDEVVIKVVRQGEEQDVTVILGKHPFKKPMIAKDWAYVYDLDQPWLGISMEALNEQLAEYFGVETGLLVKMVHEDSPAYEAGLQAGDIITAWEGQALDSNKDLYGQLRQVKKGDLVNLSIKRRESDLELPVTLGSHPRINDGFHLRQKLLPLQEGSSYHELLETLPKKRPRVRIFEGSESTEELREELENLKKQMKQMQRQLKSKKKEKSQLL